MAKGFGRRFVRALAGAGLVLFLPASFSYSRPPAGPGWWEIRLTVTVKGTYSLRSGGAPITGEYTCRARWEGSLEVDGDDFLLYHTKTDILEWRLEEKTGRPGSETVLEEKDADDKPILRLNYVLKDEPGVEVDFDFLGIPVPLHPFPVKVPLEFPSTNARRDLLPELNYVNFISRGSNRVVIPAADLRRPAAERKFSWEWRRARQVAAGTGRCLLTERHAAAAVVSFITH